MFVLPHDPAWFAAFAREAGAIRTVLGEGIALRHIGGTAIPGILAKPVIDLLGVVGDLARADAFAPRWPVSATRRGARRAFRAGAISARSGAESTAITSMSSPKARPRSKPISPSATTCAAIPTSPRNIPRSRPGWPRGRG